MIDGPSKHYQYSYPSLSSVIQLDTYNELAHALNCDLDIIPVDYHHGHDQSDKTTSTMTTTTTTTTTHETSSLNSSKKHAKNQNKKKGEGAEKSSSDESSELKNESEAVINTGGIGSEDEQVLRSAIEHMNSSMNTQSVPSMFDSRHLFVPNRFMFKNMRYLTRLNMMKNSAVDNGGENSGALNLIDSNDNEFPPKCVNSIVFSAFNPPSGNRKMRGDLFYLEVQTLEEKTLHITATCDGFYWNCSTGTHFSPNAVNKPGKSHTLLGLLWELSPLFKKHFPRLMSIRMNRHPFEVTPMPFPAPRWFDFPKLNHTFDRVRAEESLYSILGNDPRNHVREWNEEYQSCKEMPRGTMTERVVRDRTLFKVHSDFVDAATAGAKAVVDKSVLPINPMDPKSSYVYIQNNIFFSFAVDNYDGSKFTTYLDEYAHANANNDLKGVIAFNEADVNGVHTLATAIIDYKGHRVLAQSIIPGILYGEQGSSHVYGSLDDGETFISSDEKYFALMKESAEKLHMKQHAIYDKEEKVHVLCGPSDCKGIAGSDGRFYVLDLVRTTPRDANFVDVPTAILRPELLKFYTRYKMAEAIKEKSKNKGAAADGDEEQHHPDTDAEEQYMDESMMMSTMEDIHSIQFNPDVFTSHALAGAEEENEQDKKDVIEISGYLKDYVIEAFIIDVASLAISNLIDGRTLTEVMHDKGINMRYLGHIATRATESKLPHLRMLCEQEMLCRAAKHEFSALLRSTPDDKMASNIELFLNCFLGCDFAVNPKKKKKKSPSQKVVYKIGGSKDPQITPAGLRVQLKNLIERKYRYKMDETNLSELPKLSTLRNFALKVGLVVACRDYTWNQSCPFGLDDILDLIPVVKHSAPRSVNAYGHLEVGQQQLALGNLERAFEFFSLATVLFQQVKGPMNYQVSLCFSFLGTILYHASDLPQSLLHQYKALIIAKRVMGVDNAMACQHHQLLGMLCHFIGQKTLALKHFLRAKYIFEIVCGFDHPDYASLITNLAMMYQELGDVTTSVQHLKEALRINEATLGEHFQTASSFHALAVSYNIMSKFREALDAEKKSYNILMSLFGKDDPRTKESSNWIGRFTKLAVKQTKAVKQEMSSVPVAKGLAKNIIGNNNSKTKNK